MNNPPNFGSHLSLSFAPPAVPPAARAVASSATTPTCFEGAYAPDANTGGPKVPFVAGGASRVIYLPFVQKMICSAIVPGNPVSGVNRFYTDNLSGCSIFIDRVNGTNDIVVCHGNREDLTVTPIRRSTLPPCPSPTSSCPRAIPCGPTTPRRRPTSWRRWPPAAVSRRWRAASGPPISFRWRTK
jgi:hypothetical protein